MSKSHLLSVRNALLAPNEPPHAAKIEDADPQPVPKSIIRRAVPALPVNDIDIADVEAIAPYQRRHKTVQPIEIGQRQKHIATERLESTPGIACAVLKHRATHRIGNA